MPLLLKNKPKRKPVKRLAPPVTGDVVACDTETTGLSPWQGDAPFAFSFCNENGDTAYAEFFVHPMTRKVDYTRPVRYLINGLKYSTDFLYERLKQFFANPKIQKVFWNAKFDVRHIQMAAGMVVAPTIHEGMFAAHACNSSEASYALKPWAKKYADFADDDQDLLQETTVALRRHAKAAKWKTDPDIVETDYWLCQHAHELMPDNPELAAELELRCADYATKDAERTMLAWMFLREKMDELEVRSVYDEEMRLWPYVMEMEDRGVRVDPDIVASLRENYDHERIRHYNVLMEVGERAREEGALDKRGEGVVVQIDRLKNGRVRRLRLAVGEEKPRWFAAKYVVYVDAVEEGDTVDFHEPFRNKEGFNPGSDQQLAKLLYDYLGLVPPVNMYRAKKKKTVQRPVDADSLFELAAENDVCDHVLKWRAGEKAISLLDAYKQRMEYLDSAKCWLLHADFNQCGPKTGRFSCRNPNLQQSASKSTGRSKNPIDTRAPFGPRPGYVWFCIDYSQVEVRIFADLCQESEMLRIIKSGAHIHKACADHVWGYRDGKPTDASIKAAIESMGWSYAGEAQDTPEQKALRKRYDGMSEERAARLWLDSFEGSIVAAESSLDRKNTVNRAKLAIFTRIFGGGIPSIMNLMHCTREQAQEFLNDYGAAFPEMDPWIKSVGKQARAEGGTRTAFDRWIVIDDPEKSYRACNNKVQGSAADLMKRGMRRSGEYLRENRVDAGIVMTIHDELVFEFRKDQPKMPHILAIKEIMEDHGGRFSIPLPTEVECVRKSWNTKSKIHWIKSLSAT